MSIALQSSADVESNKDAYDAEFEGDADVSQRSEESPGSSQLCVDRETSCIYTY